MLLDLSDLLQVLLFCCVLFFFFSPVFQTFEMLNFNCKQRAVSMGYLECFKLSLKLLNCKPTRFLYQNNYSIKLSVKQIFFSFDVTSNMEI